MSSRFSFARQVRDNTQNTNARNSFPFKQTSITPRSVSPQSKTKGNNYCNLKLSFPPSNPTFLDFSSSNLTPSVNNNEESLIDIELNDHNTNNKKTLLDITQLSIDTKHFSPTNHTKSHCTSADLTPLYASLLEKQHNHPNSLLPDFNLTPLDIASPTPISFANIPNTLQNSLPLYLSLIDCSNYCANTDEDYNIKTEQIEQEQQLLIDHELNQKFFSLSNMGCCQSDSVHSRNISSNDNNEKGTIPTPLDEDDHILGKVDIIINDNDVLNGKSTHTKHSSYGTTNTHQMTLDLETPVPSTVPYRDTPLLAAHLERSDDDEDDHLGEKHDVVSPMGGQRASLNRYASSNSQIHQRPSFPSQTSPMNSIRLSITPKGHLDPVAPIHILDTSGSQSVIHEVILSGLEMEIDISTSSEMKDEDYPNMEHHTSLENVASQYSQIKTPIEFMNKHKTIVKFVSSMSVDDLGSSKNVLSRRKRRPGVSENRNTLTFSKPPIPLHELPQSPKFQEISLDVSMPRDFLTAILKKNLLFSGVDDEFKERMVNVVVDKMRAADYKLDDILMYQGAEGKAFYAVESGKFDILVRDGAGETKSVAVADVGHCVGEYALLYNQPRTATLKCISDKARVWGITAEQFMSMRQRIMDWNVERFQNRQKFLHSIPLFQKLEQHELLNMTHACHAALYDVDDSILNENEDNRDVYIIMEGTAVISFNTNAGNDQSPLSEQSPTQNSTKNSMDLTLSPLDMGLCVGDKELGSGDYFARNLFVNQYDDDDEEDIVNARAHTKCKILKIMRDDFILIMQSSSTKTSYLQDNHVDTNKLIPCKQWENLVESKLSDFEEMEVLGIGSFGKVTLVVDKSANGKRKSYALKQVSKYRVVRTGQEEHILNEKRVLTQLESPFCIKLYATYMTDTSLYFLTEVVLGGELFTVLRFNEKFDKNATRFYAGCVTLAFAHLHSQNIIYRDLKPENLLLNSKGYLQLTDFGFAKWRNTTCTLCGTPQYLAPEVIHNWVQSFATDWWALGVLLFEMVVGHPPFEDDENVKMYEKILVSDPIFPKDMNAKLKHLIEKLLEKNAYLRLGCGQGGTNNVKEHPFFKGKLDWNALANQTLLAPYVPEIKSDIDVSNFDHFSDYDESDDDDDNTVDLNSPHYAWVNEF